MTKLTKMLATLLLFSISGCASSTTTPRVPSASALSLRLNENMLENQVIEKIGYRPNRVEVAACGQNNIRCKLYFYEASKDTLVIYFTENFIVTRVKKTGVPLPEDPSMITPDLADLEKVWSVSSWRVIKDRL
jgi:hypothetical protein